MRCALTHHHKEEKHCTSMPAAPMTLCGSQGTELKIETIGSDGEIALVEVEKIFREGFREEI